MGWNAGYRIFEQTVVGAYDLGVLDKALLSVLLEPYRDTDIDEGGSRNLLSRDGLNVEEIVIKVWGLKVPKKPDFSEDEEWTEEQEEMYENYLEDRYKKFRKVTKNFGW